MKVLESNIYLEELNNVFSQAMDGIKIIQAKDYIVEFANDYYLDSVAKNADIIGKPLFESFPELIPQGVKTIIDKVFETGVPYISKEFPLNIIKHKTIEKSYFNLVYKPIREQNGVISKLILITTDVTEQVNFQIRSEEAEHLYHELIYSSPSMMAVLKGESMTIDIANNSILQSWGKGKDIIGKSIFEVMPEIVEQGFDKLLLEVFRTGIPFFAYEQSVDMVRNGKTEIVFYNFIYQSQRNVNGKIEGVAIIANEVTKQALLHQKLEQNEHRFRNLVESAPNPICILKGEQMILEVANTWVYKIWNVGEEALGRPFLEIIPEMKDQPFMGYLLDVFHTGVTHYGYEEPAHFVREDGKKETVYFNFFYQPYLEDDGTRSGVMVVANDVTEQVLSRKKIEESEYRYHSMIHNSSSMVAILRGEDLILTVANDAILTQLDKGKEVIGLPFLETVPELEEQGLGDILRNVYATGITFRADEMPIYLNRAGVKELLYFTFTYQAQKNIDGQIEGIVIIGIEVTPQALINKKVKESESHFRMIAEMMPEKVTNATPDGKVIFYNKSWTDYTGVGIDQLLNESWGKWIHPDDVEQTHHQWNHSVETGDDFDMELRMLNQFGEYRWHKSRARAIKDNDGKIILWIGSNADIHQQKQQTIDLEMAVELRTAELQKANEELQKSNQEIALSMYNKRFLTDFAERFSVNNLSNEFFDSVVQFIADITGVDYVFIGKITKNKNDSSVHTISMTAFGKITNNITYTLRDNPCAEVIDGTNYTFPENCKNIFPLSQTIIDFNVNGYVGLPLYGSQGKPIAIIAVMCQRKIQDPVTISSILRIVARRVEIEFERISNEELLQKNNLLLNQKNTTLKKINEELNLKNKEIIETREKLLSEYSRSLIEASLDPLFVISPAGKITDMNQAAIKVTGITRQKLTGTNFYDYFTDPQKARKIYKEVSLKGFVTDYPLTIKDHVLTDVLFNGSIYKDEHGNVLGAVVVARDITEIKKVEKQLYESKENAENAQKIAESATKSKQQFLSNMSHEMRTPMNAIIGFTKVMLKTELSEKQKEYLSAIELSGDALIVLIDDILDLAKVEAGKMTFEQVPFKLSSTVSSMLHLFEPKLQEKNIKLMEQYDERIPEVLLGDPVRLNQVMLNLLSNAVKFTSEGKITVSVELLEEDDKKATIKFSINDTGIGIKKENLETIFGSFQQASNDTTRLFGGTGLGLSIVKQLLELQGGQISAESEVNEGSTFSFSLTFLKSKAKVELIPNMLQLDTEMRGIKVLVVEDMALNQLLMKTLLDDFGFGCDIAVNGKVALEKLYDNPYDIILMDLQMPEMNGFEATEYIRNKMKLTIPIIALTADVTTVDQGKCKNLGMNDYIAKPIDEKLLYRKMVTLIKNAVSTSTAESLEENAEKKMKFINLEYLNTRTKSNPKMIKGMIEIYLEQTPALVKLMKASFKAQDWKSLSSAAHKMIPSFSIMGMSPDFENMARKIQDFANTQSLSEDIEKMVLQLETICGQACEELKYELKKLE